MRVTELFKIGWIPVGQGLEKMRSNMAVQRPWGGDMPGMLGARRPVWLNRLMRGETVRAEVTGKGNWFCRALLVTRKTLAFTRRDRGALAASG